MYAAAVRYRDTQHLRCHMKGHSLITSEKVKWFKGQLKKRKKKSTVAGESERKNKEKKEK